MPTVKDFINDRIKKYPTLYACSTYKESEMTVMGHFLNTIGNGIRNNEELSEHLDGITDVPDEEIIKYIENEIYYGYSEIEENPWRPGFDMPKAGCRSVYCTEIEKDLHPEIKLWIRSPKYTFKPYPCFDKDYSTVWWCPSFIKLGQDWKDKAVEFYQYCREWFEENEQYYHYAYPKSTDKESEKTREAFLSQFNRYKSNEEISKAYEHPYDGDLEKFLVTKWQKEKQRIFEFIDETIALLSN